MPIAPSGAVGGDRYAAPPTAESPLIGVSGDAPSPPPLNVAARDVGFAYGRRRPPVIDGLTASFGPASTVLLGPNGAGKSTLLRLLAGSLRPAGGCIDASGRVGFSPQAHVVLPGFSVRDQVTYAGWLGGLSRRAAAGAAQRSLEAVAPVDLADRGSSTLSGGERARLGIACALSTDPDLLLLDEPSAALDPLARESVRSVLCDVAAAGKCVLATSHTAVDIGPPFERLVVLDAGRIVFDGSPAHFFDGVHENATVDGFSRALRAGR